VYVYFDNDHNAYAPRNALELIERLGLFVRRLIAVRTAPPPETKKPPPMAGALRRAARAAQCLRSAYATFVTFAACGPFGPCVTSNSTRSFSERLLKPSA
jgi:hypothetical protein